MLNLWLCKTLGITLGHFEQMAWFWSKMTRFASKLPKNTRLTMYFDKKWPESCRQISIKIDLRNPASKSALWNFSHIMVSWFAYLDLWTIQNSLFFFGDFTDNTLNMWKEQKWTGADVRCKFTPRCKTSKVTRKVKSDRPSEGWKSQLVSNLDPVPTKKYTEKYLSLTR